MLQCVAVIIDGQVVCVCVYACVQVCMCVCVYALFLPLCLFVPFGGSITGRGSKGERQEGSEGRRENEWVG